MNDERVALCCSCGCRVTYRVSDDLVPPCPRCGHDEYISDLEAHRRWLEERQYRAAGLKPPTYRPLKSR